MNVSVALATYNGAAHLREQLASIVGQTTPPAELVVSDDGSSDDTLQIVRAFAETAPFPVVIVEKTERFGFADNFLHAAEHCTHEFVAFCDQDDVWLPAKLETCASRLTVDDSLIALHTLIVTDASLKPTGLHWTQGVNGDETYAPLELDPYTTGWGNSMMFRRELTRLIDRKRRPPQPERPDRPLSHDTWIYMLAAALGRVSHIATPLILYRQHGANAEGVAETKTRSRLARLANIPLSRFRERSVVDGRMATLFEELGRDPGPFAAAAGAAAMRFQERTTLRSARTRMFEEASISARLNAYRDYHRLARPRPHRTSRAKALMLGVAGLHAAFNGRAR